MVGNNYSSRTIFNFVQYCSLKGRYLAEGYGNFSSLHDVQAEGDMP
jgi:hypothetical protein